ncbi:MAG: putative glutathione S-transferase [Firmicutes bacterium]|nr:putative glutathione S-transferase [Bacillota bacterium]
MPEVALYEGIELFERTFKQQIQSNGEIKTQENLFIKKFGDAPGEWPVVPDRYRLIWMPGCPHAHKVVITRKLLGLEDVISLGTTGIFRTPKGWVFSEDPREVDPVLGIHYLHDVYIKENSDYVGRSTVPIIVDTVTGKGVNNDHFWLSIYLNKDWKKYHKKGAPDLYPIELKEQIDKLNNFIYERINVGVYNCGFARSQAAYEKAYDRFFEAMDFIDLHLADKRFLFGDFITDSDVRLYPSLARFQVTYYQVFRANRNRLEEFKNLWPYARDLYQTSGFKETTHFELIKKHYQVSPHLRPLWGNVYGLVSKGPDLSGWVLPHDREKLSKHGLQKFLIHE